MMLEAMITWKDVVMHNDYDVEGHDQLLSSELLLPNIPVDGFIRGTVIKRA